MNKWKVLYSKTAYEELDNIYKYIAEKLLAPKISREQVKRIMSAISTLDEMPFRNPLYDKEPWRNLGLRKFVIDNYIAFYYANENTNEVIIMHIFYGGRDIDNILK
ncbi:MAG: type II toxin-antitoxin system RelE/ParE family toxin [Clostridia bacterium]|nr:type II toxin-antitoxin system RelE/ParE family toxin [Clostridia bacterium]